MRDCFEVRATMISNEFIDGHMAMANGEYLKEYLYVLRHQDQVITVSMIADALDHTEADVRRALAYWRRTGALEGELGALPGKGSQRAREEAAALDFNAIGNENAGERKLVSSSENAQEGGKLSDSENTQERGKLSDSENTQEREKLPDSEKNQQERKLSDRETAPQGMNLSRGRNEAEGRNETEKRSETPLAFHEDLPAGDTDGQASVRTAELLISAKPPSQPQATAPQRPVYSPQQVSALAGDENFSQLLYIAQKYMNKVFTQRECEVFAYLYDGLSMSADLLEYVVEYCVQGGHTGIRYIETVALSWHDKGITTTEEAKSYGASFGKDTFAVMKAFGINNRNPGDSERAMIDKWFKVYGFTRELVLEACSRTLEAIHAPSFKYADKILSGWKKAGVRSFQDVHRLDEEYAGRGRGGRREVPPESGLTPMVREQGPRQGRTSFRISPRERLTMMPWF